MENDNYYGLFIVRKIETFESGIKFEIKPKLFLSYEKAYLYVLEAFRKNMRPIPWKEKWQFPYDSVHFNYIDIYNVIPICVYVRRERF